jgi:hypothetical protein
MKINVSVDVDDMMEHWESIDVAINDYVKEQIMKLVRRDPKYKAFINDQAAQMLENLGK